MRSEIAKFGRGLGLAICAFVPFRMVRFGTRQKSVSGTGVVGLGTYRASTSCISPLFSVPDYLFTLHTTNT